MLRESLLISLDGLLSRYGTGRERMLPVLQDLQEEYGYLGEEIINEVARAYDISQTEVFSVASFYHFLNTEERGTYIIRLCRTVSCELRNKNRVLYALESELGIRMGETTRDRRYTLDYANCMGMCDHGPSMMVNEDIYSDLTPSRAVEIVRSYR